MLKIYILSLLLFHLGFVRGNFCCRDGVTWVPSAKVCDGSEDCPRSEVGDGGEDEEGCSQEEGSGAGSDISPLLWRSNLVNANWCLEKPEPAENDPSISFLVNSNYEEDNKIIVGITILNCKNLPKSDLTWTQQDPDAMVEVKITPSDPSLDKSWTNTTELIMNNRNPDFNQTLVIEVNKGELLQTTHPRGPQLTLTVLDWDVTNHRRPIATTALPLVGDGQVRTKKLDLFCTSFWGCLFG